MQTGLWRFILIFIVALLQSYAWAESKLSSDEISEITAFSNLSQGDGNLLTPPKGSIRTEVSKVRSLVISIIEELAGAQLRAKGIHFVVNIYGDDSVNAWAELKYDPDNPSSREANWKEMHPDKIWPIRKFWGFEDDGKPIVEFGITTGLLRKLSTLDELAFLLGHEATHVLEGHIEHSKNFEQAKNKWWSSQAHEVTADQLSIDLILGKYELEAALSFMDKLHPETNTSSSTVLSLLAGGNTHHSEGPRISALQFYIEYLRRYNSQAKPKEQKPLPTYFKLNIAGRTFEHQARIAPETIDAYKLWVQANLEGKGDYSGLENESVTDQDFKRRFQNLFPYPAEKAYSALLKITLDEMSSSSTSKKIKMETFLKSLMFLGTQYKNKGENFVSLQNWFIGWNQEDRGRLARFLTENTVGPSSFSFEDYKKMMADLPFEYRELIETILVRDAIGQEILLSASRVSPTWSKIIKHWTSIESFISAKGFEVQYFYSLLMKLIKTDQEDRSSFAEGKIKDAYQNGLTESLKAYTDSNVLFQKINPEFGRQEFIMLLNFLGPVDQFGPENESFVRKIFDAIQYHIPKFKPYLIHDLSNLFKSRSSNYLHDDLRRYLEFVEFLQFDRADFQKLVEAYDVYVENTLRPRDTKQGVEFSQSLNKGELVLVGKLIENSHQDRAKALGYIRFILLKTSPSSPFPWDKLPSSTTRAIHNLLSSLTPNEFFAVLEMKNELVLEIEAKLQSLIKDFDLTPKSPDRQLIKRGANDDTIAEFRRWGPFLLEEFVAGKNLLRIFSETSELHSSFVQKTDIPFLKKYLSILEKARLYAQYSSMFKVSNLFSGEGDRFLIELLVNRSNGSTTIEDFVHLLERILKLVGASFTLPYETEISIRKFLLSKFEGVSLAKKYQWLSRASVQKFIGSDYLGQQLAEYVALSSRKDKTKLKSEIERVFKEVPLREKFPDAYSIFRNQISEDLNIQPHEIETIFPQDNRSTTQQIDSGRTLIRGLSAFSTFTRGLSFLEQIEMIDFVMGRTDKAPNAVVRLNEDIKGKADAREAFFKMREDLKYRNVLERSLVVNSILAGPNSMLNKKEGFDVIQSHLLKPIKDENKETAKILLNAIARAEGRNKSLILSYALAQKLEGNKVTGELTEGLVLKSLLDYFGVPGVKLAQYLAFTSDFKDFQAVLEMYQDAAMPISYYEALLLLQKRLGAKWDPSRYRIIDIIGSGSVNIAIEYQNLQTGKSEVISIARDEVEVKTQEDFRRFKMLMEELTRETAQNGKFDFVVGLMDIIQKSVTLEFDKMHSFKMQKSVQSLYKVSSDGWNIQTVDAFSVEGMAIFMEKAPGIGARKVLKSDPAAYESAMRAFMRVEYGILRGVNQTDNWIPVPLHANPDMHDGQILIDVANRTVTVLDFGQAIKISNQEREFALDILRIISKAESLDSTVDLIQNHSKLLLGKKILMNRNDLAEVLQKTDRMDVFVRLLSAMSRSGFDVPLSTVHWVLAANRLIKLGEKVRLSPESSIKWMLGMRKLGLPLSTFNAVKSVTEKVAPSLMKTGRPRKGGPVRCSHLFTDSQ